MKNPQSSSTEYSRDYTDSGAILLLCAILLARRGYADPASLAIYLRAKIAEGHPASLHQPLP